MTGTLEWATYPRLLERSFFERTKALYDLEQVLQTPIPDSMHWTRRFEYPWIIGRLQDRAAPTKTLLDVGAGATALQFMLSDLGHVVHSVDPDPKAIEWVRERGWKREPEERVVLTNNYQLPSLPFRDEQFDTSVCISVLEHLPKDQVLPSIRELLRVSRKEVLITMDVCLQRHLQQTDMGDFDKLRAALGAPPVMPGPNVMTFHIDGHDFNVACIHFIKD
jgi:2-polyprenyl-3-methyl-5-hydroxy-6-metoxy-1,4-benzoquinol methylase